MRLTQNNSPRPTRQSELEGRPLGTEWIVDVSGCDPKLLARRDVLERIFSRIVRDLRLHPVRRPVWHVFPGAAGITGVLLLKESHLACHTFPELGYAAFNLYCCRHRPAWPWAQHLCKALGAPRVSVRAVSRVAQGFGRAPTGRAPRQGEALRPCAGP